MMAMRGSRGRVLWGLQRRKLGLPVVILSCSLFFFAGFFGPLFFSQDPSGGGAHRVRYTEAVDDGGVPIPMPHGESGESRLSPIPFQVSCYRGRKASTKPSLLHLQQSQKPSSSSSTIPLLKSSNSIDSNLEEIEICFFHVLWITRKVLSWKPRALYFPKFATAEQCETIIRKAKTRLKPSTLALREGETEETTKGVRTSSGTFVSASEDLTGTLSYIEQKIARATMIPRGNGEAFNILRYEIGQKYASHYDAFNPAEYGPQKSQRVASFLLYLSDVEEGGETMFPFENGENMHSGYDYQDCIGLKVKPRQGDGLLFYSLFTNGTIDPTSLHGSCPVIKGEKWVATKWIRDQNN